MCFSRTTVFYSWLYYERTLIHQYICIYIFHKQPYIWIPPPICIIGDCGRVLVIHWHDTVREADGEMYWTDCSTFCRLWVDTSSSFFVVVFPRISRREKKKTISISTTKSSTELWACLWVLDCKFTLWATSVKHQLRPVLWTARKQLAAARPGEF